MSKGMMSELILETPVAIIDFETTGLAPGPDRVVEVSVVRADPGKEPVLILDSLVNPDRPMAATEIHGITDQDVADAPRFFEVGGDFMRAISGCIVASYNVYFDIGFLTYELLRMRISAVPPHICLMYLRPLLDMGKRCSLSAACSESGIPISIAHQSASDALASAQLWQMYLDAIQKNNLKTFKDLSERKQYKFLDSLSADPLPAPTEDEMPHLAKTVSRAAWIKREPTKKIENIPPSQVSRQDAIHRYWSELTTILADLDVSREEIRLLDRVKKELKLTQEEIRGIHGLAFANLLAKSIGDHLVSSEEQKQIRTLYQCLSRLGWAPGQ